MDMLGRIFGRVYLIPISVESLTYLTLSNRLAGHHLLFLPPARSLLPTLLTEHLTIITSMDTAPLLKRRNRK
jgi:hypothetical protein